jgi:tetratricopeptide (TPR) repeat protein
MKFRALAPLLFLMSACAVPRAHTDFSLSRQGGSGEEYQFVSSTDLRVSGLVSEGLGFANIGRLYNAEGRLRQALYLEPNNDRIAFNLAVILNQAGQSQEALEILRRLVAKEPRNPAYLQALADAVAIEGDHEEAKAKLKDVFVIFKEANNLPRAALIARSISNIAFGFGNEPEALCYSFEAVTLTPIASQVSAHLRLLVALNLFEQAKSFAQSQGALAMEPAALHALAMAKYATGDFRGAVETEESALGRVAQAPGLGQEMNAAWLIMRQKVPDTAETPQESDERRLELQDGAVQFVERAPYELVMWPTALRRELVKSVNQWKQDS